jgi:hypothetical protein
MSKRNAKQRLIETLLFLATLTGCAAQKPAAAKVVIPRYCMEAVELTEGSRCTGADKNSLHCTGLKLTVKSGCEQLQVINPKQEVKK